jgi:hypothetical protein
MNRGRIWTAADRTGGPLDELLDQLRAQTPGLIVERLRVTHAADDDNVYFIGDGGGLDRVQLYTAPDGQPTFYIESGGLHKTADVSEAADTITRSLMRRPPAAAAT